MADGTLPVWPRCQESALRWRRLFYNDPFLLLILLILPLLVIEAAVSETPPPLSSFGYVRLGGGVNRDGGAHACYQLPGAQSKYRLGNECDAYGEVGLRAQIGSQASPKLRADLRYAYFGSDDAPTSGDFSLAEAWVGVSSLLPDGQDAAQFWIGRRFYKRNDVHLIDFFYWFGTGDGLGVEEIDVGVGKLAYAYFRDKPQPVAHALQTIRRRIDRHDLQLSAIKVNSGGTLTLGADWRRYRTSGGGDSGTGGWLLNLQHKQVLSPESHNVVAVQFGRGIAQSMRAGSDLSAKTSDKSLRFIDHAVWRMNEAWVAQAVGLIEWRRSDGEETVWTSLGARPIYALTDTIAIAGEFGVDIVDPAKGDTRTLTKLTLAPMLTAGRDYFDRPQWRLYATYARWNKAARSAGLTSPSGSQEGLSFGIQMETWW